MSEDFIEIALREFKRLKALSDDAVAQVSEAAFFQRDTETDNSIAILYKHMSGNLRSRWTDFLDTDGEKPWRDRDSEFALGEDDSYGALLKLWDEAWSILFDALSNLNREDLDRAVVIRGESLSALQAISRQLTHYAYHVGQVVLLAKRYAGGSWESLSIPLGQSEAYNQSGKTYLDTESE